MSWIVKTATLAIAAALASLGLGIAALFIAPLGIAAGVCGTLAGLCAVAAARSAQGARAELALANVELTKARTSFDETLAMAHEEANRHRLATETLVGAPPVDDEVDADLDMVFDPSTGLLDERFFAVIVQQRVAAARRQLQPLSIVLFEIDGFSEASEGMRADALAALGDVIRKTLRECDSACRIGDLMAAAILEDTTEAGAVWAAERVRSALTHSPSGRGITLSAGVACYPSHALGAPELVAMAGKALESARSRGRDHVEIAPTD